MTTKTCAELMPKRERKKRVTVVEQVTPEFLSMRGAAVYTGMSKRWIENQVREYRQTGGKRGLPEYRPSPRRVLVSREECRELIQKFRT